MKTKMTMVAMENSSLLHSCIVGKEGRKCLKDSVYVFESEQSINGGIQVPRSLFSFSLNERQFMGNKYYTVSDLISNTELLLGKMVEAKDYSSYTSTKQYGIILVTHLLSLSLTIF